MKGLSNEDKDYDSEELLKEYKEMIMSTCPSKKRTFTKSNQKNNKKKSNNINIITNLNHLDMSQLSKESPEKLRNSLNTSYYKKAAIGDLKFYSNKIMPRIRPFNSNNKNAKINNNNFSLLSIKKKEFPEIKDFNLYYEIPFHGKYDFIFLLRGGLSKNEWFSKTKIIRKYPIHLKNTLFFQEKLRNIHEQTFSKIYHLFLIIKNKGINLYENKKYRECLESFNFAYGLFKWIEFKDKNVKMNSNSINNECFSILDDDIEEKEIISDTSTKNEEELYKFCVIYILEIMACCHMELRIYSYAIECLDECVNIAGNYLPDVYLRRAQARICNKKISDEELKLAEKDIDKSIDLVLAHNATMLKKYNNKKNIQNFLINTDIYYKTKMKYNQIIQKRLETKVNNITKLLGTNINYKTGLLFDKNNDNVLYVLSQDNERQYKILKEIKKKYNLAVKFFTETKNKDQLDLTYKEYESFYEVFNQFKYFYKFSVNSVEKKVLESLNDNEKKKLLDEKNKKMIERNKKCICEYIFAHGNYNVELYKYVVEKIFKEEKEKKELENKSKLNIFLQVLNLSKRKYFILKTSICFIILSLVSFGFQVYYFKNMRAGIANIDKM